MGHEVLTWHSIFPNNLFEYLSMARNGRLHFPLSYSGFEPIAAKTLARTTGLKSRHVFSLTGLTSFFLFDQTSDRSVVTAYTA